MPLKKSLKKPKKKKLKSIRSLIKKLDSFFSTYIRKKYADSFGMVSCFTCGVRKDWKNMQNSHYASRRFMSTRFDEENCHPACMPCNVFLHGNLDEYAIRLKAKYGEGILERLNQKKHQIKQWRREELEALIAKYKA